MKHIIKYELTVQVTGKMKHFLYYLLLEYFF